MHAGTLLPGISEIQVYSVAEQRRLGKRWRTETVNLTEVNNSHIACGQVQIKNTG
jgi:hypothetical protein